MVFSINDVDNLDTHIQKQQQQKIKQTGRNFTLFLMSYTKLKQNVSFKNLISFKFTEENMEENVYGLV